MARQGTLFLLTGVLVLAGCIQAPGGGDDSDSGTTTASDTSTQELAAATSTATNDVTITTTSGTYTWTVTTTTSTQSSQPTPTETPQDEGGIPETDNEPEPIGDVARGATTNVAHVYVVSTATSDDLPGIKLPDHREAYRVEVILRNLDDETLLIRPGAHFRLEYEDDTLAGEDTSAPDGFFPNIRIPVGATVRGEVPFVIDRGVEPHHVRFAFNPINEAEIELAIGGDDGAPKHDHVPPVGEGASQPLDGLTVTMVSSNQLGGDTTAFEVTVRVDNTNSEATSFAHHGAYLRDADGVLHRPVSGSLPDGDIAARATIEGTLEYGGGGAPSPTPEADAEAFWYNGENGLLTFFIE